MAPEHIFIGSKKDLVTRLLRDLGPGDWILVKGSRAMGMETIVQGLREKLRLEPAMAS
jgi:UDP-N-acetylmuramyl pentapeptide synthase